MESVLQAILPVLVVIAAGFMARRVNWLTAEADRSLMQLVVNILMPCFIVHSFLGNEALKQPGNILLAPAMGFLTVILGMGVTALFLPLAREPDLKRRRTAIFATGTFNYGYIPLPLAILLFDRETVGILLVHNVGVEFAIWSVGLWILERRSLWHSPGRAPLIAITLGLLLNLLGFEPWTFVATALDWTGSCAIPMGLILIGATMADILPECRAQKAWRISALSCGVRGLIMPLLMLGIMLVLPASLELKRVLVLQAAMPCAVVPILLARHYGGHAPTALNAVIATSVLSVLTIPLWLHWGFKWLGQ